jgi:YegS/Rv2252/BmrU family lipid kinase
VTNDAHRAPPTPADRTVFLVNPASANGTTGRRWPEIAHRAAAAGLVGETLLSREPGDLTRLARQAVDEGASLLVVVGGDGSVNEVVNGLVDIADPPPVAIVPRGTGWDFVRTFGIPRDVDRALHVAVSGLERPVDVGLVRHRTWAGEERVTAFANVASVGMSGAIAARANETTKALGGKASYLWATFAVFARWSASDVCLTVDGERREGRMFDVIVANGRYLGGGMKMCPDAEPDDGVLDVLTTMPKIYRGTHLPHPKAELLRGAAVTIDADEPLPIQLDGEQPGTTPVRIETRRGAFSVRVPRDAPAPG